MLYWVPLLLIVLGFYAYEQNTLTHVRWYWGIFAMFALGVAMYYWPMVKDFFRPRPYPVAPHPTVTSEMLY
jgi:hypothetical protein